MKRKLTAKLMTWVLTLALLISALPITAGAAFAVLDNAPVLGAVWDGTTNTDWYDPSRAAYSISTPEQLAGLARLVNTGVDMADKMINLTSDIYLNPLDGDTIIPINIWTRIGTDANPFNGTFDGNGHTIRGMRVLADEPVEVKERSINSYGFFGKSGSSALITNLNFEQCYVSAVIRSRGYLVITAVGGVIGHNTGRIDKCSFQGEVRGTIISAGNNYSHIVRTGGIIGYQDGNGSQNLISHAKVIGTALNSWGGNSDGSVYTGGICGYIDNAYVSNVFSTSVYEINIRDREKGYIGGIAGFANAAAMLNRAYYLYGTADQGVNGDARDTTSSRTEANMKTQEFAELLGAAFRYVPGNYPALAFSATPPPQPPSSADGWKQENGYWYYYQDGVTLRDWQFLGGKWYYLDPGTGRMRTGWLRLGSVWYYLHPVNGDMKTGWLQDGGQWYFLAGSGAMHTGWVHSGGKWYYMSGSGAMYTGWLRQGSTWYYLDPVNGDMYTGGPHMIDGEAYYFDASGAWMP